MQCDRWTMHRRSAPPTVIDMSTLLPSAAGTRADRVPSRSAAGWSRPTGHWPARLAALVVLLLVATVTWALPLTDGQQLFLGMAGSVGTLWILLIHEDRQDAGRRSTEAASDGPATDLRVDVPRG